MNFLEKKIVPRGLFALELLSKGIRKTGKMDGYKLQHVNRIKYYSSDQFFLLLQVGWDNGQIDNNITRFGLQEWGHANFSTIERLVPPYTTSATHKLCNNFNNTPMSVVPLPTTRLDSMPLHASVLRSDDRSSACDFKF
ncbi:hypothetical protein V6N13_060861 [Hibiscus sabdariffa]